MSKLAREYIGSVSSGTLLPSDLIPAFVDVLEDIATDSKYEALVAEAHALYVHEYNNDQEDEILQELQEALNELAPAYFYFGAHEGDGADFGFWLSDSFEEDFDGLRVNDTAEVPADYVGEVLHVSDHGNPTLYAKDEGSIELREIWSLV